VPSLALAESKDHIVRTLMYTDCAYTEWNMRAAVAESGKLRAENINLRVSRRQKTLIDSAADALGRNRSDFMLDVVCREAESILLDKCYFNLGEEEFQRFTAMLDNPPAANPKLTRLLMRKPSWEL